jgi:GT2 family glycosyltransferase
MLVERAVFEGVGLLDEEYFFSFEDLDLCLRARAGGFATVLVADARGYHEGGATIGATSSLRLYYGTRNHLRLACSEAQMRDKRVWPASVLALNLAHAVWSAGVPRGPALVAVLRGARDHMRGRYGEAPAATAARHRT